MIGWYHHTVPYHRGVETTDYSYITLGGSSWVR